MKSFYRIYKCWAIASAVILFCNFTVLFSQVKIEEERSSRGKEFWVAFPPNEAQIEGLAEHGGYVIYVSSDSNTTVTLEYPVTGKKIEKTLPANTITTFTYNDNEIDTTWMVYESEQAVPKGIRISSEKLISVYVLSMKEESSDGYLALPVKTWGNEYIHAGFYDYSEQYWELIGRGGGFLIVASENNTQCEIILRGIGTGQTIKGNTIGDTLDITLDKGEVYPLRSDGKNRGSFDLTGTLVISSKPVGFISFHMRTTIPSFQNGIRGRDHLNEMLPPTDTWGKKFHTFQYNRTLWKDSQGDFFRLIAKKDSTEWNVKYYDMSTGGLIGLKSGTLTKAGDFFEYNNASIEPRGKNEEESIKGLSVWEADEPVMLIQYSYSHDWDNNDIFDPFMIYVTPDEQYSKRAVFQTPEHKKINFYKNYFNMIAVGDTTDPEQKKLKSITIDGEPIWEKNQSFLYTRFPGSNLYWTRVFVNPGSHVVEGDTTFSGYIYGYGSENSYGWPAGLEAKIIYVEADTLEPQYELLDEDCGIYHYRAFEERTYEGGLDTIQIDSGIDSIGLYEDRSTNFSLEYVTSSTISKDSAVFEFEFNLRVQDKSKPAHAEFFIRDNAGNITSVIIDYQPEDRPDFAVDFAVGEAEDIRPGFSVSLPVRIKSQEWQDADPIDEFSIEILYETDWMSFESISKGNVLDETWNISAKETRADDGSAATFIEASGTTALAGNGIIAEPKFSIYLTDTYQFGIDFGGIVLGERDSCLNKTTTGKTLSYNTCVKELRLIVPSGTKYSLQNISPNPISGNTANLEFSIGLESRTVIEIYGSMGERKKVLIDDILKPGIYDTRISLEDLTSGVYYLRMMSGPYTKIRRMIIWR